jgi:ketosteroid isomerase-like protein
LACLPISGVETAECRYRHGIDTRRKFDDGGRCAAATLSRRKSAAKEEREMASPDENPRHPTAEELGREYLRALQAKDKAAILAIMADDITLVVPCALDGVNDASKATWSGLTGPNGADINLDKTFVKIDPICYPDLEFTPGANPDIAFAEGAGEMVMITRRHYRNMYVFRFDSENGKLKRIREYVNPITWAIAMGVALPEVAPLSADEGAPQPAA